MANRFGGRFSPDGFRRDHRNADHAPAPNAPIRHRLASRPKWVTIAATPFLLGAFGQQPVGMVTDLAGFGLIAAGMWMTTEGLAAEAAYQVRRVARRPAIPRKLFGGVAAALGLGLGAADPSAMAGGVLIGATGLVMHFLAFGADPMRDKGMEGADNFQRDRAHRMIDEGEGHLAGMRDAILRIGDRRLEARVSMFAATVEEMFARIIDNPADLSAVRRYMGVYLEGARDATVKFADLYSRTRDASARAAYESFLDDLENDFKARSARLLEGDRTDLDIEISVLRDRLAREGVRAADPAPERPALTTDTAQSLDDLLTWSADPEKARRD